MNDLTLERTSFNSLLTADYFLRRPKFAHSPLFILLHGYSDRAQNIWRKITPLINQDFGVLAPNGMYPIIIPREQAFSVRFAWYFYDTFKHQYFINQGPAAIFLKNLLTKLSLQDHPITIIGHSQGGYLAPFAALEIESTTRIIGLNCQFKADLLPDLMPFELIGLNAESDEIVDCDLARKNLEKIIAKGNNGQFLALPSIGHYLEEGLLKALKEFLDNK